MNTTPKNTTIGFIGLGIMGVPMAGHLLDAGYRVVGFARTPQKAQCFIEQGGVLLDSPKQVGQTCDILITIVSDTPDVEEMLFGDNGAAQGLKAGSLVIDMSTINPHDSRLFAQRLSEQGVSMLDAPVSGGDVGAIEARLSIMVGGSEQDLERALPLFNIMGKTVTHIGSNGAGQVSKACNQLLVIQIINGVAEALRFAESNEVDAEKVRQALLGGLASCRVLEVHAPKMIDKNYAPGFKAALHLKDLNIVAQEVERLGLNLPGAELGRHTLEKMMDYGESEADSGVMHKYL